MRKLAIFMTFFGLLATQTVFGHTECTEEKAVINKIKIELHGTATHTFGEETRTCELTTSCFKLNISNNEEKVVTEEFKDFHDKKEEFLETAFKKIHTFLAEKIKKENQIELSLCTFSPHGLGGGDGKSEYNSCFAIHLGDDRIKKILELFPENKLLSLSLKNVQPTQSCLESLPRGIYEVKVDIEGKDLCTLHGKVEYGPIELGRLPNTLKAFTINYHINGRHYQPTWYHF